MDMNTFMKHRYTGENNERLGFTKGEEYHRVSMGSSFYDNTYGVYVTSDEYNGSDIDYCNFMPIKTFNSLFTPPIPLTETPIWRDKGHEEYLKRKKKLNIARNNFGKEFVDESIKDGTANKLYHMSYKCTCASCAAPHSPKEVRKIREMDDKIKEFMQTDKDME